MDWHVIRDPKNKCLIIVTNNIKKIPLFITNSEDKDVTLTINDKLIIVEIGDMRYPLYIT